MKTTDIGFKRFEQDFIADMNTAFIKRPPRRKVYLIRASEWETDINCVCATKEIAERECKRLAEEYGLSEEEARCFIECIEMDVIEPETHKEPLNVCFRHKNDNDIIYGFCIQENKLWEDIPPDSGLIYLDMQDDEVCKLIKTLHELRVR